MKCSLEASSSTLFGSKGYHIVRTTYKTKDALNGIVGKHIINSYDNGWQYELYVKDAHTLDYRIHSGMVGGRWVKDQQAFIVALWSDHIFKISWDEPTETAVSLAVN